MGDDPRVAGIGSWSGALWVFNLVFSGNFFFLIVNYMEFFVGLGCFQIYFLNSLLGEAISVKEFMIYDF